MNIIWELNYHRYIINMNDYKLENESFPYFPHRYIIKNYQPTFVKNPKFLINISTYNSHTKFIRTLYKLQFILWATLNMKVINPKFLDLLQKDKNSFHSSKLKRLIGIKQLISIQRKELIFNNSFL